MSRRTFLMASAGAAVAAACGGGGSRDGALGDITTVFQRFPPGDVLVPGRVRLPVSLADADAALTAGPPELRARIRSKDGGVVVPEITADLHRVAEDLPVYWPFRAQIDEPGVYELEIIGASGASPAAFQVMDPASVAIPKPGDPLPPFDTPTVDNARGVDPICSRLEGTCPLHTVTLSDALRSGTPVLYIVGTPAHCSTGVCAPGLDYVLAAHERVGGAITMVHADVFADDAATTYAPAVTAYKLSYEPVVFLADASGTIVERIDIVWDQGEIDAAIEALLS